MATRRTRCSGRQLRTSPGEPTAADAERLASIKLIPRHSHFSRGDPPRREPRRPLPIPAYDRPLSEFSGRRHQLAIPRHASVRASARSNYRYDRRLGGQMIVELWPKADRQHTAKDHVNPTFDARNVASPGFQPIAGPGAGD